MNSQKKEIDKILRSNNNYEILGLSRDASKNDVKQAYKANALKYHPDKTDNPRFFVVIKKQRKSFTR